MALGDLFKSTCLESAQKLCLVERKIKGNQGKPPGRNGKRTNAAQYCSQSASLSATLASAPYRETLRCL